MLESTHANKSSTWSQQAFFASDGKNGLQSAISAIQRACPVGRLSIFGDAEAHRSTSPLIFVGQDLISRVFLPDIIKDNQGCFIEIDFIVKYYTINS